MKKYKLDFGKDTVESIIHRKNNKEPSFYDSFIFKDKRYSKHGVEVGNYSHGAHSLFIHSKHKTGYKIFLGQNHLWNKKKRIQVVCNFDRIMEIKKIYDILYEYRLCPKVYNIFSVKIYFNNHNEKYKGYGLKLERIIRKKSYKKNILRKEWEKRKKKEFLIKLETVCKNNFIVRLSWSDRRVLSRTKRGVIGSLIKRRHNELFRKKSNIIYSEKGYILVDIDVMLFINENFISRRFVF